MTLTPARPVVAADTSSPVTRNTGRTAGSAAACTAIAGGATAAAAEAVALVVAAGLATETITRLAVSTAIRGIGPGMLSPEEG
jgi:hypothetical protein